MTLSDHITLKSTRWNDSKGGKWDLDFHIYAVLTIEEKARIEKELDEMLKRLDKEMRS